MAVRLDRDRFEDCRLVTSLGVATAASEFFLEVLTTYVMAQRRSLRGT